MELALRLIGQSWLVATWQRGTSLMSVFEVITDCNVPPSVSLHIHTSVHSQLTALRHALKDVVDERLAIMFILAAECVYSQRRARSITESKRHFSWVVVICCNVTK